jgi:hypothetical protein
MPNRLLFSSKSEGEATNLSVGAGAQSAENSNETGRCVDEGPSINVSRFTLVVAVLAFLGLPPEGSVVWT